MWDIRGASVRALLGTEDRAVGVTGIQEADTFQMFGRVLGTLAVGAGGALSAVVLRKPDRAFASWSVNYEPINLWDHNWDFRDPCSCVKKLKIQGDAAEENKYVSHSLLLTCRDRYYIVVIAREKLTSRKSESFPRYCYSYVTRTIIIITVFQVQRRNRDENANRFATHSPRETWTVFELTENRPRAEAHEAGKGTSGSHRQEVRNTIFGTEASAAPQLPIILNFYEKLSRLSVLRNL